MTRHYGSLLLLAALFVFSYYGHAQIITTIAGNGNHGYNGDGIAATAAELFTPADVCMDKAGNLYIADYTNNRVRKVNTSGIISTIAGTGIGWYNGDSIAATGAELYYPINICVDATGDIYISDYSNYRVRKIDTSGIIWTIAGNGAWGYSGDGGPATAAQLFSPAGICLDRTGNIYIADVWNNRIRKVDTSGIITTIAGNGVAGYSGDGAVATAAQLYNPAGIYVDTMGNVYIADETNCRIRKVDTSGIITTIAGKGTQGYSGDGGPATAAQLFGPASVCLDAAGNLYISDYDNFVIRKVDTAGIISTFAGNDTEGYNGDGGNATATELNYPDGICMDASGNLYIADADNNRVRKVSPSTTHTNIIVNNGYIIKVYPNPATQTLNFEFPAADAVTIKLMDVTGRVTDEQVVYNGASAAFDVRGYTSGIYFYQVTMNGKTQSGKIVIIK